MLRPSRQGTAPKRAAHLAQAGHRRPVPRPGASGPRLRARPGGRHDGGHYPPLLGRRRRRRRLLRRRGLRGCVAAGSAGRHRRESGTASRAGGGVRCLRRLVGGEGGRRPGQRSARGVGNRRACRLRRLDVAQARERCTVPANSTLRSVAGRKGGSALGCQVSRSVRL